MIIDDNTLKAMSIMGKSEPYYVFIRFLESERVRLAIERKNDSSDYIQELIDQMKQAENQLVMREQIKKETQSFETGVI